MGIEYFYKDIDRHPQRTSRIKQSTITSSYR
jgi:hypothetical protein